MPKSFLISRNWARAYHFAITDDAGNPQYEVRGRSALARTLVISDAPSGAEVAVMTRRPLSTRYQIRVSGQETSVRARGFTGRRFEIDSPGGPLEARGNFSGRHYAVARRGELLAAVTQLRTVRERFAVEVADHEDPVLMLAIVLVIEIIRDESRRRAASG